MTRSSLVLGLVVAVSWVAGCGARSEGQALATRSSADSAGHAPSGIDQTPAPGLLEPSGDAPTSGAVTQPEALASPVVEALVLRDPSVCDSPSQFTCTDYIDPVDCWCNDKAPRGQADCAEPWSYVCDAYYDPVSEFGFVLDRVGVGCRCDASRLGPDACGEHYHYSCAEYFPQHLDCVCNSTVSAPEDWQNDVCCVGSDWGCHTCLDVR